VVLLDMALPGLAGAAGAARLISDPMLDGVRFVLVLSQAESDEELFHTLRAGAGGLLVKDAQPRQLVDAIRAVAGGGGVLSPSIARRLIDEFAALPERTRPCPDGLAELTPREREVVALVAGGMNNLEIAAHLVISPATAKTHVSRALGKLDVRDRAQLVTLAYETGLIVPRAPLNAA
jgi:DNA-binding NarL/FixJ family response regulator